MQFTTVAIVLASIASASASLVARQASPYPDCVTPCLASANFGTCNPADTVCLCKSPAFISGTTTCIEKACTGADLTKAIAVSQQACASVGAPLTSASAPAASSPAPSASTPAAASSSAPAPSPSKGAAITINANSLLGVAVAGLVALAL